jgi:hypothetical protein
MNGEFVARVSSAQRDFVGASLELWNVRAEHLKAAGDVAGLLTLLADPVASAGDNCECNRGCNVPCGSNCGAVFQRIGEADGGP